jgi:hypothetical protein
LIVALSLTACSSSTADTGGAAPALSVSGLVGRIKPAADAPTSTCPVAFDVAAGARAAGLTGAVSPAAQGVDAATDGSATGADFLKQVAPAATLQCSYRVGDSTVHALLIAVSHANTALNFAMPQLNFWSGGDLTALTAFVPKAQAAPVGTATAAPGNKAAVVRLKVDNGDAVLAVGVETSQSVSEQQIGALAETLAKQVRAESGER